MKLPKPQTSEDHPFLDDTKKSVRIALENLSQAPNKDKYGAKNTASLLRRLWRNTLVRWILLVLVLLCVFVQGSQYYSDLGGSGSFHVTEIPELDFTLDNLISASIGLSVMAAEKINDVKKRHAEGTTNKGKTHEGVNEPVTEADRESNYVIINGLRTLFKNSRAIGNENGNNKITFDIISEETNPKYEQIVPTLEYIDGVAGGDSLLDPDKISIIVDPLDATKEFTEERDVDGSDMLPFVTTLICIVQDETPIAGIVGRPFVENEPIMWGVATEKAHQLHGVRMSEPQNAAKNLVTVSRSHTGKGKDVVKEQLGKTSLPAGGAGYKSYLVLTGQVDAYIHVTAIKTWDLCAGHALLRSVGGDITDKDGKKLRYTKGTPKFRNGLIASLNPDTIQTYAKKLSGITLDTRRRLEEEEMRMDQ
eukprot:35137_1